MKGSQKISISINSVFKIVEKLLKPPSLRMFNKILKMLNKGKVVEFASLFQGLENITQKTKV